MVTVLELNHVWKKFHRGEFHDCLRDAIPALVKSCVGLGPKRTEIGKKDFWALQDIDFKVEEGERLGIIGHNGAGKSTLLKILSNIIAPNRGSMMVRGKLRALIEVGAGFHGDLTGRENIYLNGAILGMSRKEIDRNFDSIIDFSGIEDFLDMPVKRYSSGMAARLGFAVAAHLDPDILIVDEVLSVGDTQFQKKCLGKMNEVANTGRTVLFVSHNMAAVRNLCSRTILLNHGKMVADGKTSEVISNYLGTLEVKSANSIAERTDREGTGNARVLDVKIGTLQEWANVECFCTTEDSLRIRVQYRIDEHIKSPVIMVGIAQDGDTVQQWSTRVANQGYCPKNGEGEIEFIVSQLYLIPGKYSLYICIGDTSRTNHDIILNVGQLTISQAKNGRYDFLHGYCYKSFSPFEWRQL